MIRYLQGFSNQGRLWLKLCLLFLLFLGTQEKVSAQNCTANAGGNIKICGDQATLTGAATGNLAAGGVPSWIFLSGPGGIIPTIVSPNTFNTNITGMTVNGDYTFQLNFPCSDGGISSSQVVVTAHPRPASFTAGAALTTGICATTGTVNLADAVIPAGYTGHWTAASLANPGFYLDKNSQFSNPDIQNPDFSLIKKGNHDYDPAYKLTLTITSADGLCTYTADRIVKFCPNGQLNLRDMTICRNGGDPTTYFDLGDNDGPLFNTEPIDAAGHSSNGTTVLLTVNSQPAGANMQLIKFDRSRISFSGATLPGVYNFTFTITTCCGTFNSTMNLTVSGTRPSTANFEVPGHTAEQFVQYNFGGSAGEAHCSSKAGTFTPETFYFDLNATDDFANINSIVTSAGILPPGASMPIVTVTGTGLQSRTVTVDPGASGWKVGTYKFNINLQPTIGTCTVTNTYYIHISDGARQPVQVNDSSVCYPGAGTVSANIALPPVYQGIVNSSYFQEFTGRYVLTVISKPAGSLPVTLPSDVNLRITNTNATISNLSLPGDYKFRLSAQSGGSGPGEFLDNEYTCSGGIQSSDEFTIHVDANINSNAGSDQTFQCSSDVALQGNSVGSTGSTGLWTVVSVPSGAVTPILVDPTQNLARVRGFDTIGTYVFRWTITSANSGCLSSDDVSIAITTLAPVAAVVTTVQPTCSILTGSITITNPLPNSNLTYSIDNGANFQASNVFNNLAIGTFQVIVNDSSIGCRSFPNTITLSAATGCIDAVDDTLVSVNGKTGAVNAGNVLTANPGTADTIDGVGVLIGEVDLTVLTPATPIRGGAVPSVDPSTGNVIVPAGTPAGTYTVTYRICNKLISSNCDTAIVTIPVTQAAIDAVNDAGSSVNGKTGGTSFTNVLSNDTLNGVAVVAGDVTTTFVSATSPGITLSGTNVVVAPGTPAGNYTLTYRICELLNPTNCDQATVTIPVTQAAIDAVNDAGSSVNGKTGGTSFTNVLSNDTLNGVAVVAGDVTTTFVSATNPGITLSGTNVVVAPGTPAGNYTLTYSICELLNPTNCDQATVTIPVTQAAIDAVNDAGSSVNGKTGGTSFTNVLSNDTLNGVAVVAGDVTTTFVSATNPGITLSGTNVVVAPGTPAGNYTLTYSICELLNPSNCDQATVTVTVTQAAIDAVNDAGSSVNGKTGGTSFTNVLSNDTLNGVAVVAGDVTTTFVSATSPGITLSGTNVVVAPGTSAGNYTLTYRICELLNPTNCDQATVTIPVTQAAIDAVNDAGSSVNGKTGGTSFTNVLSNDTLNGVAVVAGDVTTTFVSATNPGITLSGTNVVVAPGTPAGNYTLTYRICELLNPTNCDQATVTIPVTQAAIDAVNDAGSSVNGKTGGTSFTNVLSNDTLNGVAVVAGDVTTTFVSATNPGITLSGTNVVVAPGTPAGNYTLTYSICELLNPTNCDQATVTVTVTQAAIDAVNDAGSSVNGKTGGTSFTNVLSNDTLNGVAVVAGDVTTTFVSATSPGITLSGTNVVVAPGTPAGNYTLTYSICELLNPTNCDQATVTVTVTQAAIDAVNDAGSSVNGKTGGTSFTNVLSNDTLNGVAVVAGDVTTTFVSATSPGITLSGTNVVVAPGTPAGNYTLTYRICELLNPTNCDQATVTIPVTQAAIDAVNDAGSSVNGKTGGTSFTNVLSNDTLNGVAVVAGDVTTTFVSATSPGITLSGTNVVVAPGTPAGNYTLTYSICELLNPTNCDQATVTVTVTQAAIDAVNDAGSSVNGKTGGTSFTNVLSNDTLNGVAVVAGDVTTTFVSATSPGITLSGTNVVVAPGTPAGNYTLTYRICELLNPTNCDQATVTIPVTQAAIDAVNDAGSSVNGKTGGTSFTNVLSNDTLNGVAVVAGDVTTTFVSATSPGITLSGTNVVVAPGTSAGNYTLTYSICELLNPTNCDQATVTIPVTQAAIDAVNDAGSSVNGKTGGTSFTNVLSNDTLNGVAVVAGDVTTTFVSATSPGITLSGTNVVVAPGTPAGNYTLTYSVCELLNPTNCDQATVTVTVTQAAIDAVNDAGSSVNGKTGGTSFTNVLSNDTLNGVAVVAGDVTTTFVSATSPGITLSGTNVVVAPGTSAGNYTLTYSICELLNPTNCDQATVTIPVTQAAIDAVNDAGSSVNGKTGGTSFTNVLSNDTLNGVAVVAGDVTTTFVSATSPGITLSGTNVVVAPGTPAGNYTLTYSICELLNPTNCDQATVTVTVTSGAIDAVNDAGSSVNGKTGGTSFTNVLSNDTLNGVAVVAGDVTTTFVSATSPGITLSGTNVVVAPGTPAGNYTLTYSICELLNPTNCDQATVTVIVTSEAIDAVNDAGSSVNGKTGGTSFTNVLSNDTLNGVAVVAGDVTTTFVNATSPGITLSGTNVLVAPGTAAGNYTLTYSICELLNPTNCDQAIVTVIVTAGAIDAVNDAGSSVNGKTGGTSFTNVLSNDTLNGVAVVAGDVTTTFVSATSPGITLSGTNVLVAPGTAAGNYTLTYSICELLNPTNCDEATVNVTVWEDIVLPNDELEVFNAVSPNGDGLNDVFYIRGIENYPDNTVEIYNRWGVLVFERNHYNNTDRAFNGFSEGRLTINKSEQLPVGTYYYVLKYKNSNSTNKKAGYLYINQN
jgi:gliding motility-associated-like protein